jgi:hypothetical protein
MYTKKKRNLNFDIVKYGRDKSYGIFGKKATANISTKRKKNQVLGRVFPKEKKKQKKMAFFS